MSNDELLKRFQEMARDWEKKNTPPCPSCGHCPTCGRRSWGTLPPYPYYPTYPSPTYPWITWGSGSFADTTTSDTITYTF